MDLPEYAPGGSSLGSSQWLYLFHIVRVGVHMGGDMPGYSASRR